MPYYFRSSSTESVAARVVRNRRPAAVECLNRLSEMSQDWQEEEQAPQPVPSFSSREQITTPGWRLSSSAPTHRYMLRSLRR